VLVADRHGLGQRDVEARREPLQRRALVDAGSGELQVFRVADRHVEIAAERFARLRQHRLRMTGRRMCNDLGDLLLVAPEMVRKILDGVKSFDGVSGQPPEIRLVVWIGCIEGVVVLDDRVSPETVLSAPLDGARGQTRCERNVSQQRAAP